VDDAPPPSALEADYFDGRSAQAHAARLHLVRGELQIRAPDVLRRVPMREVQWPERTRHGARVAHLPGGGSLHCADAPAWDAWLKAGGRGESLVVKAQQSWRWALASVAALVLLLAAMYQWGLPALARAAVAAIPLHVDQSIGEAALRALDGQVLAPSGLSAQQQQRLQDHFQRTIAALPAHTVPAHRVVFRKSRIGPNAFALPGGTMVMTDELVALVDHDAEVVSGVLAHELGHVRQRHGMRMLVQASALGIVASVALGDFSSVLAGVPVLLGQAGYSRDFEREADAEAVRVLKAAGVSPEVMVTFFEKVAAKHGPGQSGGAAREEEAQGLGIAIASHPADAERIRFFRDAAAAR
jgi:predicted Zn-dependent protease